MKASEIRALSYGEMGRRLEETHRELFNLRFRYTTGQLVNYNEIRKARKNIARVETIMRERELGIG